MIRRLGTFGYYALLVAAYYLMIVIVAGIVMLPLSLLVFIGGGCWPMAGIAVAWHVAVAYFIVLGLLGYWVYYLPTPLESEVAFPETEDK